MEAVLKTVSTHAPRAGGDPPRRCSQRASRGCFNPRPPRGGRRPVDRVHPAWRTVSTHAPRAGGDPHRRMRRRLWRVSTHAPRAGGDLVPGGELKGKAMFQPTPPARGATGPGGEAKGKTHVSTHAPRAGGDPGGEAKGTTDHVSTHAPRAGGDPHRRMRRRLWRVSTHAPRAGGDWWWWWWWWWWPCFNPRPPRGGRRPRAGARRRPAPFQPTPPARGATHAGPEAHQRMAVSTHAPRAGGDLLGRRRRGVGEGFNPRPPRGGRLRHYNILCIKQIQARLREPLLHRRTQVSHPRCSRHNLACESGARRGPRTLLESSVNFRFARRIRTPAVRPDHRLPCFPRARLVLASSHRAGRNAGCPTADRSCQ